MSLRVYGPVERFILMVASALAISACQPFAQSPSTSTVYSLSGGHLVEVRNDRGSGFVIRGPRGGPWQAEVALSDGPPFTITSGSCPALSQVVAAFEDLPPLTLGWPKPTGNPPTLSVPPTRKHGADWRVSSAGFAPDVSQFAVTLQGSQGPYASWAEDAIVSLSACA